jgi:transcriptional regulator with PAS, ATPase and Fis domain
VQKNASVLKDAGGRIKGVVETFTDLSALVQKEREIGELNRRLGDEAGDFHGMVGRGEPMRRLFDLLEKAAQSDGPIVLYGESGVGKELAARALHCLGPNWNGPFVQLNCGALNEHLMESELFGHVKGAFTGAHRHRRGRFEAAHGGDIFLDEIGDMPPSLQVRLLRVLETKSVERVGDQRPIPANARVIAATHQDLDRLVADGLFRRDLFFRINFFPIFIPPLRDRMEDLPHLVDFFRRNMAKSMPKPIQGLTAEAWRKLERHDWPGNVRELKSVIEFGWVMCGGGYIQTDHLPPRLDGGRVDAPSPDPDPDQSAPDRRRQLIDALERTGGNRTRAARLLGVSRVTVWKWIKKYGLPDDLADG